MYITTTLFDDIQLTRYRYTISAPECLIYNTIYPRIVIASPQRYLRMLYHVMSNTSAITNISELGVRNTPISQFYDQYHINTPREHHPFITALCAMPLYYFDASLRAAIRHNEQLDLISLSHNRAHFGSS